MTTSEIYGAVSAVSVTASDTVDFVTNSGNVSRGLLVATAGNYTLWMGGRNGSGGQAITCYLAAGVIHPIRCKRVFATGAASTTGIVAFF
jgi:hypothetical protein